jgi:ubiquitin carboxyl-terminal hydrolase 14
MEVEKERGERRKVRKRTKVADGTSSSSAAAAAGRSGDVEMSDATIATTTATASNDVETTTKEDKGKGPVLGGGLEDEGIYRAREAAEFEALVDTSLKNDLGCSTTGLYELVGLYLFLVYLFRFLLHALFIRLFFNADFQNPLFQLS